MQVSYGKCRTLPATGNNKDHYQKHNKLFPFHRVAFKN